MPRKGITLPVSFALAALLGVVGQSSAQYGLPNRSVYVETNNSTPGQNPIPAFRRNPDGKLTQLKGSPYLTDGTGVVDLSSSLATFANDTPVIANRQRTLLFAVNVGSNTIAVFHFGGEGNLTAVEGSPFPSGGYQPVSLTLLGDILTVVNKNGDPAQASAEANAQPNYSTFRVDPNGSLSQYARVDRRCNGFSRAGACGTAELVLWQGAQRELVL